MILGAQGARALKLACQVGGGLPGRYGVSDFRSDAWNVAQVSEFRLEDGLGRSKDLQEFSHAHGTNVRQHVQSNEGLRLRHGSGPHTLIANTMQYTVGQSVKGNDGNRVSAGA